MIGQAEKILIYAVSRATDSARLSNLPNDLETRIFGELAVFFSCRTEIPHDIEALKHYHDVISELHSADTIIPFRYGSVVENLSKMQIWVEGEKEKYLELLSKLNGLTEMSLRVVIPSVESSDHSKSLSGREYLLKKSQEYRHREKDAEIVELLRTQLQTYVHDLKYEKRDEILSVYFLIKKNDVQNFCRNFAEIEKKINFKSVLTGGWCPFNFCTTDV